jgi:hypothetical protein
VVFAVTDLGFSFESFLPAAEAGDGDAMLSGVDAFTVQELMDSLSADSEVNGQLFHWGEFIPVFGDDDCFLVWGKPGHIGSPLKVKVT